MRNFVFNFFWGHLRFDHLIPAHLGFLSRLLCLTLFNLISDGNDMLNCKVKKSKSHNSNFGTSSQECTSVTSTRKAWR